MIKLAVIPSLSANNAENDNEFKLTVNDAPTISPRVYQKKGEQFAHPTKLFLLLITLML
jgi:hypothetical protein